MGLGGGRWLLNDPRLRSIPMYLETPKGIRDGEDLDVINLHIPYARSFANAEVLRWCSFVFGRLTVWHGLGRNQATIQQTTPPFQAVS